MEKRKAWMSLQEHHMPAMKDMALGKKYTITAVIEPHELGDGENEYGGEMMLGMGGKMQKPEKPPMRGRFEVHSIEMSEGASKKAPKEKAGKSGRY